MVYSLKSSWVQQTSQFIPLVLELSLIWPHLHWGEFKHFLQLKPFTFIFQFSFHWVAVWTEAVWYERFLPNTSTHLLTSVIRWELVNLPYATIYVGDSEANRLSCHGFCSSWNVHLEVPLFMYTLVQILLVICSAVCDTALSLLQNKRWASAW